MPEPSAKNTERVERAVKEVEKSADRSTVLAADRTIFAAERTYAAWVRTGLTAESWSKWFGKYIRDLGIKNPVFHSFRHNFKDALRAGGVAEDLNDALTGHTSGGGVGRTYGAKDMMRRFGLKKLHEAVSAANYEGLDLSHLHSIRG